MQTIAARFRVPACRKCGRSIEVGTPITAYYPTGNRRWVHASCYASTSKPEPVAPRSKPPEPEPEPAPDAFQPEPEPVSEPTTSDRHAVFDRVLSLVKARRNTLLIGPSGCGKTHLAAQVAEAAELAFGSLSCTAGISEGHLRGRLLPTGESGRFEYTRSHFVGAYEEGGLFLLDEVDACDPNVLLSLNTAIDNGYMSLPERTHNPRATRHANFILIASANTYGTGADRQYVGRYQLDEAFLERFRIGQVELDYDRGVDATVCPDVALRERLWGYRERARAAGLRRVVASTRFLRDAYAMVQAGWSYTDVDAALFVGYTAEERKSVCSE